MKQLITLTQLNGLSYKARERLNGWALNCKNWVDVCSDGGYDPGCPLLNIGEMIEFLDFHNPGLGGLYDSITREDRGWIVGWMDSGEFNGEVKVPELCDALWEAVKSVLEQDETA